MVEHVNCAQCGEKEAEIIGERYENNFEYKTVVCYNCGHRTEYAYPLNIHHKFYVKE